MKKFNRIALIITALYALSTANQWLGIVCSLRSLYPNTSPLVLARAYVRLQVDAYRNPRPLLGRTSASQMIDFENHIYDILNG